MRYATFIERKDYAMKYVVPAFRKYGTSHMIVDDNGLLKYNKYGNVEKECNVFQKYANAIAYCGRLQNYKICLSCGQPHFDGYIPCRNRFCPVCQKAKSLILFAKLYPYIIKLIRQKYIVKMMTFTIKDTENLEDGVKLIKKAFRVFSHENKKYREVFENLYIGGIKSLEVKRGENSKQWHPHFHALVIMKRLEEDFIPVNVMWNKSIVKLVNNSDHPIYENRFYDDNFNLVDGKLVFKDKLGFIHLDSINDMNMYSRVKAIYECVKYITKYDENLDSDLPELVKVLKGIRSVDSWGTLRGIETDIDNMEVYSESETREQICSSCGADVFETLQQITREELVEYGYSKEIKDFNTKQNELEKKYEEANS